MQQKLPISQAILNISHEDVEFVRGSELNFREFIVPVRIGGIDDQIGLRHHLQAVVLIHLQTTEAGDFTGKKKREGEIERSEGKIGRSERRRGSETKDGGRERRRESE